MTTDIERQINRQMERQISARADSLVERLAEKLGGHASARAVYAEPVERDGVTVIGVAKVRMGFGGGGGEGQEGGGSGGGGGTTASPLGYIEIRNGVAEFRPIKDTAAELLATLPLVLAGGFVAAMVLGGMRKLIRGR